MQRKLYTDFDLLFDSIGATALILFGDTRCLFSNCNLLGDLLVQVWCTYKCIFYSFSCNIIDVLIKHILAWVTKGIIYASNPLSVLRANALFFGLYNVINGSPRS